MIRKILKTLLPAIPVAVIAVIGAFSNSCANTTDSPTGGDKDTIPPVMVGVKPESGVTNVPVHGAKFTFTFNEYVTIKNAKNIFLSPPQKKAPKSKISGKSVIVYFEEDLEPNTTYTIDFTDAIADNNEGNKYPGFTYVFSTGSQIDSMLYTGTVRDSKTLKPLKGITVMLYKDHADSAVFLHRPDAAVKTDDWGFFCLRNIQDTLYRIYAVKDAADDKVYDPENDLIAFSDSLISPSAKIRDSLPELMKYEMTDTVNCLARKSDINLRLFREKPTQQLIVNTVRVSDRTSYITFRAPMAHIDSMWIHDVPEDKLITQFNRERDSLEIWVNDRKAMPDTFHLYVNYRKTDTLGKLSPYLEHVKLFVEGKAPTRKTYRKNLKHEDTVCVYTLKADPALVEQKGFELEFKYPIIYENFDSIRFVTVNPKQKEADAPFEVIPDSTNIRRYTLKPKVEYRDGWDYYFKVPHRAFRDINGFYSDSLIAKVALPKDETLSKLILEVSDVEGKHIVDLLDERGSKVMRSYEIRSACTLEFPYLKAGKYCIRVTQDVNDNSIIDTGSLLEHRQPENVMFYKKDDKEILDIPESSEIVQEISMKKLFSAPTASETVSEAGEGVLEEEIAPLEDEKGIAE